MDSGDGNKTGKPRKYVYFGGLLLYLFNSTGVILVVIKEISER